MIKLIINFCVLCFPPCRFPDHFILATEACADPQTSKPPIVSLGDWSRGNQYSHSIIEVLNLQLPNVAPASLQSARGGRKAREKMFFFQETGHHWTGNTHTLKHSVIGTWIWKCLQKMYKNVLMQSLYCEYPKELPLKLLFWGYFKRAKLHKITYFIQKFK